jgi:hypothetical protein
MKLTRRQRDVLRVILAFWLLHARYPTQEEVRGALGLTHRNSLRRHVLVLWKRGLLADGDGTDVLRLAQPMNCLLLELRQDIPLTGGKENEP